MGDGAAAIVQDGYEHDVFLSYNRKGSQFPNLALWVNALRQLICLHLADQVEGGNKPIADLMFLDQDIQAGEVWEPKLQGKLRRSKVLLSILNPPYLQSKWCLAELRTFHQRAPGLVVPVVIANRKLVEARGEVSADQLSDFSPYFVTSPGYRETREYAAMEVRIRDELAPALAAAIARAPAFRPDFPLVEVAQIDLPPRPAVPLVSYGRAA